MTRVDHPPRRPLRGHSPDCPYWHDRPANTCGICRSETLGPAPPPETAAYIEPRLAAYERRVDTDHEATLGSCRRCYAPTTTPDTHCQETP